MKKLSPNLPILESPNPFWGGGEECPQSIVCPSRKKEVGKKQKSDCLFPWLSCEYGLHIILASVLQRNRTSGRTNR